MQKIVPNIWCSRNAEEAGSFYAEVFAGATSTVESRYPETGLPEFQRGFEGAPLTVAVEIPGAGGPAARLVLINAGDEFRPNHALSFVLNFDPAVFGGEDAARARIDEVWSGLSAGGTEMMPLGEYPFSGRYGWVADRFGVNWQLMLTQPEGDPRPFVIPSLMFGAGVQNRAAEAIAFYTSVFDDAAPGNTFPYGEATGPATAGALMFGEFRIGEQWFAVMDSAVEQTESFTCGVSLEVGCDGQAEIDRLWGALSAVPEAEQCGWLADQFGVSWQIVPANMGELMEKPGAFDALMGMHKIVIDEF
ncbi:putative 3-demethylubiquinone-9 3-methyltransferase (glyoxalase superfamily) [Leucobacter exalbidus]|uniref:3-demethylubiquinone-9 3-methyltransferase (Glyoxalase superfamily) n=1 Tax=Leucobacter exalbidus TaxID=662960 RepID=A0A940T4U4_9MICO|nr:VOC family protein [Leucobacter exalbidus]MBP1327602.1 putative 3-demethylubiquinone-9 3-methyltransferase (glyoxalase superfamily) [Leucobacter exalbidus]